MSDTSVNIVERESVQQLCTTLLNSLNQVGWSVAVQGGRRGRELVGGGGGGASTYIHLAYYTNIHD